MRLTNVIKSDLLERAAHYIFDKRIEEAHRMAEEAMDKIVQLFIETPEYKKNVEVYKNNKEYFRKPINCLEQTFYSNRHCICYKNAPYSIQSKVEDVSVKRKVESFVEPYTGYKYTCEDRYYMPVGDLENWDYYFEERAKLVFKNEDVRKKFSDIYIPVWNFCKSLQDDVTRICDELESIMRYIDNTTQLFTVLPNIAKLIPNVKIVSGKINLEVNEEINNLLN